MAILCLLTFKEGEDAEHLMLAKDENYSMIKPYNFKNSNVMAGAEDEGLLNQEDS
jgi:hypothetical protein